MIPIRLEMNNFQCYGNAVLTFDFTSSLIVGERDNNSEISNGAGKCLAGSTMLTDARTGTRLSIESLSQKFDLGVWSEYPNFYVMGLDNNLQASPARVNACVPTGKKRCLRITTRSGAQEVVSITHPVVVGRSLKTKEAQHLKVGELLAQPRSFIKERSLDFLNAAEARILAAFMAEGGLTTQAIKFTNTDKGIIDRVDADLREAFNLKLSKCGKSSTYTCSLIYKGEKIRQQLLDELDEVGRPIETLTTNAPECRRLRRFVSLATFEKEVALEQFPTLANLAAKYYAQKYLDRFLSFFGIRWHKSIEKQYPKQLYSVSDDAFGAFIGMFLSCDGFVSSPGPRSAEISFGLGSENLVRGIASGLKHRGVHGSVRKKSDKNGYKSWVYCVSSFAPNLLRFIELVQNHVFGPKLERLVAHKRNAMVITGNANIDIVPKDIVSSILKDKSVSDISRTRKQLTDHNLGRQLCEEYGKTLGSQELIDLGVSDVFWDQIVAIESVGELDTYDIQIDNKTHIYALDGFYTHNSAIFEAIGWALFGKSRQKNSDGVVKRGSDACEVDFLFEHDKNKYRVIRKRNSRFSKIEVLLFEIQPNGTEMAVPSDTNRETDTKIREILKSTYDVFLNSCYFMQNTISDFLNGTPAEKQKIVSSILNLERWNDYMKDAKGELDDHSKLAGNIEFKLKDFEDIEEDLVLAEDQLEASQTKARLLVSQESQVAQEISELEARASNLKLQETSLNDYHDTASRLDNVRDRAKELTSNIGEKKEEVEKLGQKINDNLRTAEELDRKIVEISGQVDLKNQVDLDSLEKELVNKKTQFNLYNKYIVEWKEEKAQKICECCGNRWDQHKEKLAEYEEYESLCDELGDAVASLEFKVSAAKVIVDKIKQTELEIEKYTGRKKGLLNNNEIHFLKREVAQKELVAFTRSLEEAQEKERDLVARLEGLDRIVSSNTYEKVRSLLKSKKEEREKISSNKNDAAYLVGGLTQKVEKLRSNKVEKTTLLEQLEKCNKFVAIYTSLVRSFSRNGIQAIIIDNVIEELTKIANKWLNEFSYEPTYVRFVTQKKDSKGGWKETMDIEVITPSGVCDFESLSGGEAFRVAFAIRLALSQIQSRRMGGESQLLLLDEVSTSLDRHGLEMFVSIIRKLEKTIKVMVVTHDDKLKDEFDHIIYVKKADRDSTLSVK